MNELKKKSIIKKVGERKDDLSLQYDDDESINKILRQEFDSDEEKEVLAELDILHPQIINNYLNEQKDKYPEVTLTPEKNPTLRLLSDLDLKEIELQLNGYTRAGGNVFKKSQPCLLTKERITKIMLHLESIFNPIHYSTDKDDEDLKAEILLIIQTQLKELAEYPDEVTSASDISDFGIMITIKCMNILGLLKGGRFSDQIERMTDSSIQENINDGGGEEQI